jgi:hypothetical protein
MSHGSCYAILGYLCIFISYEMFTSWFIVIRSTLMLLVLCLICGINKSELQYEEGKWFTLDSAHNAFLHIYALYAFS